MAGDEKGGEENMGALFCQKCGKFVEPGWHDHWEVRLLEGRHGDEEGQTVHVCEWCADALVEDGIAEYPIDRVNMNG